MPRSRQPSEIQHLREHRQRRDRTLKLAPRQKAVWRGYRPEAPCRDKRAQRATGGWDAVRRYAQLDDFFHFDWLQGDIVLSE